jgi:endonuclease YncB( thermonuclease family)
VTDPEARKIIEADHCLWPIAKAARHFLRRFLDAQGTIRASKAIIEALRDEVIKRGGKA